MTTKPPKYRAYCVLRESYHSPGRWIATGFDKPIDDSLGVMVKLDLLPVPGFDGYILLWPTDTQMPLPPVPETDEDDNN